MDAEWEVAENVLDLAALQADPLDEGSPLEAMSEAAVCPPAALRVAALLQHASQPSAGQLQAAAQHQMVRRATL